MEDWLEALTRGIDLGAPDAAWQVFARLMQLVPWAALWWSTAFFAAVGAWLGWRRGRTLAGIGWALLLGPLGWVVVLARPRRGRGPPPLPR
jgi:hypothetical protein